MAIRTIVKHRSLAWVVTLLGALALLPRVLPVIYSIYLTDVLIAVLFATSLNLVMGYGGMISFGHAAYFAVAAYTSALLTKYGLAPFWIAFVVGPWVAFILGILIGAVATRTSGTYFLMLTLAFAQLVYAVIYQWYTLTGGDDGISLVLQEGALSTPGGYYWFTLAVVSLCLALLYATVHSPFGYTLQAIRDNAIRVQTLGIPFRRYQV